VDKVLPSPSPRLFAATAVEVTIVAKMCMDIINFPV
jgi:hypothetical protein